MALSGSFIGSYKGWHIKTVWSATQNVANNTSTITCNHYLVCDNYYSIYIGNRSNTSVIDGSSYTFNSPSISCDGNGSQTFHLGTTSKTLSHNSDGSRSFSMSTTFYLKATLSGVYKESVTASSGTITLNTIPRASSVTCSTVAIGSKPTISISSASSSFRHTLRYAFGNLSGTIVDKTSSTSYTSWTLPSTFYAQIPNAKSGTGTIYCDTYSGSTLIGTKSTSFTATTSEAACKPLINPTFEDVDAAVLAVTGDKSVFVKYFSDAKFTTNATVRNSATLKSIKVTCGAQTATTDSGTFANIETNTFTFTVTDSRGYTTTGTRTLDWVPYVKLTCNITAENPTTDGDMTLTIGGNRYYSDFDTDSSAGNTPNTPFNVYYRYKENDGEYSDWITVTCETHNNDTYDGTVALTGLNYKSTYTFQAYAVDKLMTVYSEEVAARTTPVFDWGEDDFCINVAADIADSLTVHGSMSGEGRNYGENKILWNNNGGTYRMTAAQTIKLSEAISAQPHGIVLVFSGYNGSAIQNSSFNCFFVPKFQVTTFPNCGHTFLLGINAGFSKMAAKYLTFTDTTITGNGSNDSTGTNSGISFDNSYYVLRYVIGV